MSICSVGVSYLFENRFEDDDLVASVSSDKDQRPHKTSVQSITAGGCGEQGCSTWMWRVSEQYNSRMARDWLSVIHGALMTSNVRGEWVLGKTAWVLPRVWWVWYEKTNVFVILGISVRFYLCIPLIKKLFNRYISSGFRGIWNFQYLCLPT